MDMHVESVEDILARIIISLRNIRPFYSAIYESMERVDATNSIETMAVTHNKILYNTNFIQSLPIEELRFINLHEIAHVALMHVTRRKKRDPKLWNLACDLYVNKLLAEEFSLLPGSSKNKIAMPKDCCWCGTLDIEKESVDDIYNALQKQGEENGYFSDKLKSQDSLIEKKTYSFSYKGTKGLENGDESSGIFNYDIDTYFVSDLIFNDENSTDEMTSENENRRVLAEALTRAQLQCAGAGAGLLELRVNEILKSHINWKKWLQKYCILSRSTDSSFSNPDKRMFYQDAIYPGQALDASNVLKDIKVCIDTSGSISPEDLKYIYGQIRDLSKQYKISAEVVAWDCGCTSCGNINENIDITSVKLTGGGGTDPTCLFEYFDSKKCKVKPYVTIIFTDGFWDMRENKPIWKKRYKNTLWVLTKEAYNKFKPPFGLITEVKYGK